MYNAYIHIIGKNCTTRNQKLPHISEDQETLFDNRLSNGSTWYVVRVSSLGCRSRCHHIQPGIWSRGRTDGSVGERHSNLERRGMFRDFNQFYAKHYRWRTVFNVGLIPQPRQVSSVVLLRLVCSSRMPIWNKVVSICIQTMCQTHWSRLKILRCRGMFKLLC